MKKTLAEWFWEKVDKLETKLSTRDTTIKKLEQTLKELRISTSHVAIALEEEQDKVEKYKKALEKCETPAFLHLSEIELADRLAEIDRIAIAALEIPNDEN